MQDTIEKKIKNIQKRRNFNPFVGVRQIKGAPPDCVKDYWKFRAFLEVIQDAHLPIQVPYRTSGNGTSEQVSVEELWKIYVFKTDRVGIYKIGIATKPYKRKKGAQTNNHERLGLLYEIPIGTFREAKRVEDQSKLRLKKFKTRDKNNPNKCEWYALTPEELYKEVRELKTQRGNNAQENQ